MQPRHAHPHAFTRRRCAAPHRLHAEDEQLEDIRQRVRRYSQKSDEELLLEQLLKFKEEEAACLQRFAEAEKKGGTRLFCLPASLLALSLPRPDARVDIRPPACLIKCCHECSGVRCGALSGLLS